MSILFCERATACGDIAWLRGPGSDPNIPDGVHWHVTMGRDGGLPAGPTVLVDLKPNSDSCRDANLLQYFGTGGLGSWQIDADQGQELTLFFDKPAPGPEVLGWVFIQGEGEFTVSAADSLLTRQGLWPVNAARSKPGPPESTHWRLASADCQVVRITGHGWVSEAWAYIGSSSVDIGRARVLSRASLASDTAQQIAPYYLPHPGSDDWKDRVGRSAPSYRLPSDQERPGDYEPDPNRELARIRSIVEPPPDPGTGTAVQGVEAWCRKAYRALGSGVRGTIDGEAAGTTVSQPADNAYLQASVDPGVARWQGLSGTLDPELEPEPTDAPNQLGLAAALIPVFRLFGPGQAPTPQDAQAEEFYEAEIPGFFDLKQATSDFPPLEDGSRWELTLLAVPIPYLREWSQDGPGTPELLELGASWNAVTTDQWSATVGIDRVVPRGEVAFLQTAPTAKTLHPGDPGAPAPMIAGYSKPHGRHVLTAAGISGEYPAITVGVSLQDWLGRWGDAGKADLHRPARPPVPPPQGTTLVIPGAVPGGDGPASSATVRADIRVPWPAGPGAVPLTLLSVAVPREPSPRFFNLDFGDVQDGIITHTVEFAARQTVPGEVATDALTLQCINDDGGTSSPVTLTARIVDPRPVRAPVASPRLIASTRRGNSPSVTVTLAITAAPNARAYRILIAGETTLRRAFGLPAPDPAEPRAERAATVRRAMAGRDRRSLYSWASTKAYPVVDGAALATIELPSGTDGVVFARAVAVTAIPANPPTEAVSTPFERTEPAAVVVPRSDFPPVPDIQTSVAEDGTAAVTVRVTRPPAAVLASLRISGEPEARIEARLVEYVADAEPVFWPQITTLRLEPVTGNPGMDEGTVYEGTAKIHGRPWQRTAVAACVRYPPEPTLASGDTAIGGEIRSTGLQYERIPSPWGAYSTPAWIGFRGNVPTLDFLHTPVAVSIQATGLPTLPPNTPAWTMQLWRGKQSLAPDPGPAGDPVPASQGLSVMPRPQYRYAVLLIDPFGGRHGPVPVPVL
ncbi:hypothetical protein [Arthrobacter sp. NPDC056493]|uniref:hypothetical protein n=1 Tax=Arthrobacter sp. NPDC056493 TaxID=3345839 RepID=UPI0036729F15